MDNLIITNEYLLLNHYMVQERMLYYNRLWVVITIRDIKFDRLLDKLWNE